MPSQVPQTSLLILNVVWKGQGGTHHDIGEEVEGLGRRVQLEGLISQRRHWKPLASASGAAFGDAAVFARVEPSGSVWGAMTLHYVQDHVFSPTMPLCPPEFGVLPCAQWLRMGRVPGFAEVLAFYRYDYSYGF